MVSLGRGSDCTRYWNNFFFSNFYSLSITYSPIALATGLISADPKEPRALKIRSPICRRLLAVFLGDVTVVSFERSISFKIFKYFLVEKLLIANFYQFLPFILKEFSNTRWYSIEYPLKTRYRSYRPIWALGGLWGWVDCWSWDSCSVGSRSLHERLQ